MSRTLPATADDEIVISGIAGKFPSCNDVQQFADNLYHKVSVGESARKAFPAQC